MAKNRRLSQSDKISKRLRGIKAGTGMELKKAVHTVNVYASRIPTVVNGFLVSIDSTGVVFRHKKSSGSKKTRISTFQISDVVKVFGQPGEPSSITVLRSALIESVTGYVARDAATGAIKVKDVITGEITVIFPMPGMDVEVFADEDEKAQKKGKASKSKAKPKEEEEEDFDDEDEDEEDDDLDEDDEDEDEDEDDDEDEDEDDDLEEDDDEDEDDEDEDDEDLDDEDL